MPDSISIPQQAEFVIRRLEENGEQAYLVGGCVRDSLLGDTPQDWDITTSALPEKTICAFEDCRVIETGVQHGTVTVLREGKPIEVTTFRIDGSYTDRRRPDSVTFTPDLREDLARRDFTINAMAYHPQKGLYDCFGGREDLAAGVIRCVGEPDRRFQEDALRILRALRFASALGFTIEENTRQSILRNRRLLVEIARERIFAELKKLLCGKGAVPVLLEYREVLGEILPQLRPLMGFEQHTPYHQYDIYEHSARAVGEVPPAPELRMAMLLHDLGKPACYRPEMQDGVLRGHFKQHAFVGEPICREALLSLKADKAFWQQVCFLVKYHDTEIPPTKPQVRRWLAQYPATWVERLFLVQRGDNLAKGKNREPVRERLERADALLTLLQEILRDGDCCSLKDLAVSGKDLMEIGCPKGKRVGELLEWLLEQVMEEKCLNQREPLLEAAKGRIAQKAE